MGWEEAFAFADARLRAGDTPLQAARALMGHDFSAEEVAMIVSRRVSVWRTPFEAPPIEEVVARQAVIRDNIERDLQGGGA